MRTKKRQWGFTLVEVMIVVVIIAILSAIGIPPLLNSLPNMRLRGAARDIYSTMMSAKIEAIRRGENVTLLFNSPLPGGSSGGTYTMFIDNGDNDSDNDGVDDVVGGVANDGVRNGAEIVLVAATPLPDRVTFDPVAVDPDGNSDGVSFAVNAIIFTSRGIPALNAGALWPGAVALRAIDSNGNTQRQRAVVASIAGGISIQ